MLKLGCTLPNLTDICHHKSFTAKFYPFRDSGKNFLEKICEDMLGGPSSFFTRKAVVDETFIRDLTNWCKSIVGIGASQLYLFSMCQAMGTGLYTRWELSSESDKFKPRQNKTEVLKAWSCHTCSNHSVKYPTFEEKTQKPYIDILCLFRALELHLHGYERLDEETSKLFNKFLKKIGGTDPANLRGKCMENFPAAEDFVHWDIFLYDCDIVDGCMIGQLATRGVRKHSNTVRLLRCNNRNCRVSKINALFWAFRCPSCDEVINRTGNLERLLITCNERFKYLFPMNVYQLQETLFDKLESFNIAYSDDQKLFIKVAIFDFESICVHEDKICDTDTTTWIGKQFPVSVWLSSNLIEQPNFLCNSIPGDFRFYWVVCWCSWWVRNTDQSANKKNLWRLRLVWKVNSFKFSLLFTNVAVAKNQYWNLKRGVSKKKKNMTCRHSFYTNTRESTYWFAGSIWKIWQRSSSLSVQQPKIRHYFHKKCPCCLSLLMNNVLIQWWSRRLFSLYLWSLEMLRS